jgi:hypothetical protein
MNKGEIDSHINSIEILAKGIGGSVRQLIQMNTEKENGYEIDAQDYDGLLTLIEDLSSGIVERTGHLSELITTNVA